VAPLHEDLELIDWRAFRARRQADVRRRIEMFELPTGTMWRVVRSRAAQRALETGS